MDIMQWLVDIQARAILVINETLNIAGSDPISGMGYLFINGGWIIFIPVIWYILKESYLNYIQNKAGAKRQWTLLRITVPKMHEQTVKAVENLFAHLAGAHSSPSTKEKWIDGVTQAPISVEIVSIDGVTSFYVYALSGLRDLIESSIFAQYPDAEIEDVSAADYAKVPPTSYPDAEWDVWGAELTNVRPDPYPLKTYRDFEDMVSGEFKDPLAALFEVMARLGKDEQLWLQYILYPTDQKEPLARAKAEIEKIKGIPKVEKESMLDTIVLFPLRLLGVLPTPSAGTKPELDKKMTGLTSGEKFVLESIERKTSKIGFECKIRFVYTGKRTAFNKGKVAAAFIGAIKQFNTYNMQSLKPDFKKTGISGSIILFKDKRNNERKTALIRAYRARSAGVGLARFFMSTEELATLWHFPILLQAKSPALRITESKKQEAPSYIPFE